MKAQLLQKALACEVLETRLQQQAQEFYEQLEQRAQHRSELETQLLQQTQASEALQTELGNRMNELRLIRRSRYWRALEWYWRMRDRLLRRN